MQCEICGRQCLDPHTTEVDLGELLDGSAACSFHGVPCKAVEFSYSKHGYAQVVYDCGAAGPKCADEVKAVRETYYRGRP